MDIKLGDRLYDDDADEEKRKKMQANAKGTTIETLAARISGMKVTRPLSDSHVCSCLQPLCPGL